MHHGAGSSGLTFGLTAKHLKELSQGECGVIAIDARGHGATHTDQNTDFSLDRMSNDFIHLIQCAVKENQDIILVGHRYNLYIYIRCFY